MPRKKKAPAKVEVHRMPMAAGITAVPNIIRDYFAGRGLSMSWQMKHENSMTYLYGIGCVPINVKALEEDKAPAEVLAAIRGSFAVTAEGYIQRGDTLLMVMSEARRQAIEDHERAVRDHQQRGQPVVEALEAELEAIQRATGVRPRGRLIAPRSRVPDVSEHFTQDER